MERVQTIFSSTVARSTANTFPCRWLGGSILSRRAIGQRHGSMLKLENGERKTWKWYREYLRSDHWKALRALKLHGNPQCEMCGKTYKLVVHHINYRSIYDVTPLDLAVLCDACHNAHHGIEAEKRKRQRRKKYQSKACPFLDPSLPTVVLTRDLIHSAANVGGGFTAKQVCLLGFRWPPKRGWLSSLIGKRINVSTWEEVVASRKDKPQKTRLELEYSI